MYTRLLETFSEHLNQKQANISIKSVKVMSNPVTGIWKRLNYSEYNLLTEGKSMTNKICPVTNRPIKMNRGGVKHMPRYCIVDGNRYESFHQFGTSVLKKSVSEIIELRNEHFIEKHKSSICGYTIEMFYKCDEKKT